MLVVIKRGTVRRQAAVCSRHELVVLNGQHMLLKVQAILVDDASTENGGLLSRVFTGTVNRQIFFEIIQRKGDEGFGEGNFKALFESIEQDQINRGVI